MRLMKKPIALGLSVFYYYNYYNFIIILKQFRIYPKTI